MTNPKKLVVKLERGMSSLFVINKHKVGLGSSQPFIHSRLELDSVVLSARYLAGFAYVALNHSV